MKVLHIIARVNRGGTATWLKNLIPPMRNAGIEVFLAAGHVPANEIEDSCFAELGGIRIDNLGRNISLISDFRAFLEIRKLIKNLRPDIINTHTAKAGLLGRLAAISLQSARIKIVHTYHGHLIYGYFNLFLSKIFVLIEKLLATKTDLFLVSGERVKKELLLSGIGSAKKYRLIRPGVTKLNECDKFESKNSLGLSANLIAIGWMGRLTSIKRPDKFVELAKKFPKYEFIAAGEGELLDDLLNDKPSNLKFVGWQDPSLFWSACDIAVLTSDNEAQPLALVEAAQLGLPAVAENVGSVAEVIIDNVTGFLVDSSLGYEKALSTLATDSELRTTFGENARRYSEATFGVDQFVRTHIDAYKDLI